MTSQSSLNLRRSAARFATVVMVFTVLCVAAASAQAPPYALLQNAPLNGAGNTFTATYLPVVTATGTIYVDLTVQFSVDANGNLTVSSVQQVASPTPINNGFVPGLYLGPDDATEFITVTGPGVTEGKYTEWSLAPGPGASGCLYPYNAVWYDVGTAIKNSPIYTRMQKAGIKSTQWTQYGVGGGNCQNNPNPWEPNSLLGFSQNGGASLVITSFTQPGGHDQSTPVDTKTYCAVGSLNCGTN